MTARFDSLTMAFIGFAGILDTAFMIPVIALYAVELGACKALAGLIAGLYSMVAIPASLAAGVLVDRYGRRRTLSVGLLSDSLAVLAYGLVTSYAQLMAVRVAHAVGGSLVFPAFIARAREVSGSRPRRNLGLYLAPVALATAMGSISGGLLTARVGYRAAFAFVSAILMVAFLLSLRLSETYVGEAWKRPKQLVNKLKEGGRSIACGLWLIFTLYAAFGVITGGLTTSLLAHDVVEDPREARLVTGIGVGLASLVAAPAFVASGAIAEVRGLRPVIACSVVAAAAGLGLGAMLREPWSVIAGLGIFGLCIAGVMLVSTVLVTEAPIDVRGVSVGLQQVLNIVGVAVGAPLGGVLAPMGPEYVLFIAALFAALPAVAVSFFK